LAAAAAAAAASPSTPSPKFIRRKFTKLDGEITGDSNFLDSHVDEAAADANETVDRRSAVGVKAKRGEAGMDGGDADENNIILVNSNFQPSEDRDVNSMIVSTFQDSLNLRTAEEWSSANGSSNARLPVGARTLDASKIPPMDTEEFVDVVMHFMIERLQGPAVLQQAAVGWCKYLNSLKVNGARKVDWCKLLFDLKEMLKEHFEWIRRPGGNTTEDNDWNGSLNRRLNTVIREMLIIVYDAFKSSRLNTKLIDLSLGARHVPPNVKKFLKDKEEADAFTELLTMTEETDLVTVGAILMYNRNNANFPVDQEDLVEKCLNLFSQMYDLPLVVRKRELLGLKEKLEDELEETVKLKFPNYYKKDSSYFVEGEDGEDDDSAYTANDSDEVQLCDAKGEIDFTADYRVKVPPRSIRRFRNMVMPTLLKQLYAVISPTTCPNFNAIDMDSVMCSRSARMKAKVRPPPTNNNNSSSSSRSNSRNSNTKTGKSPPAGAAPAKKGTNTTIRKYTAQESAILADDESETETAPAAGEKEEMEVEGEKEEKKEKEEETREEDTVNAKR